MLSTHRSSADARCEVFSGAGVDVFGAQWPADAGLGRLEESVGEDGAWALAALGLAAGDEDVPYVPGPLGDEVSTTGWLGQLDAGPELAWALEAVDLDQVPDADLAQVLAGFGRVVSWAHMGAARVAEEISTRVCRATWGRDCGSGRSSGAAQEVALALGWSRTSAARLIDEGWALRTVLCDVGGSLEAGALGVAHARVLVGRLADQPWDVNDEVLGQILPVAGQMTPHALGLAVDKALHEVDPEAQTEQALSARDRRRVGRPFAVGQGMAGLTAVLPVLDAARVDRVLEKVARAAHGEGDVRTVAQLRADILVDVLTGDADTAAVDANPAPCQTEAGDRPHQPCPGAGLADPGTPQASDPRTTAHHTCTAAAPTGGLDASSPLVPNPGPPRAEQLPGGEQPTPTLVVPSPLVARSGAPPADLPGGEHPTRPTPSRGWRGSRWRLPPPGSVRINVTISAASLLGVNDDPAFVAGAGPIDAVTARALAHDGPWRRVVTDPVTGAVLDVGRTRYRPPAAVAAHVGARDPHCVCGTCTRPAGQCDLDHATEWRDGGTTTVSNLAPLCRASHTLKTDGHMRLTITGPGLYQWTTPLGNTYLVDTTKGIPRRRPVHIVDDEPPF
ncbi:MAG: DUF222 domain-containing protein [Micrococcales bacterium]|nr:DUF222 domain-containing protein [Micrococcales bacterium]